MEFVVLSGLALLGYEISKNGKTPRIEKHSTENKNLLKRSNKYPIESPEYIHNPGHIGKPLSQVPYFSSVRSQNTNENFKQGRMEAFTGSSDVMFQHKKECENTFKPQKDISYINGTPSVMEESNRQDRYKFTITQKMHNVAPIPKEYVGPGLNQGTDVSATGGFHDSFRILPENIGGYKKNSFGGTIIPGKGVTPNRNSLPTIQDNDKPERYYSISEREPIPSFKKQNGAITARSKYELPVRNREQCSDNSITSQITPYVKAHTQNQDATRSNDSTLCNISGNPSAQNYGNNTIPTHILKGQEREQCVSVTNANQAGYGQTSYYTDGINPTQREQIDMYIGGSHMQGKGNTTTNYNVKTTLREGMKSFNEGAAVGQTTGASSYKYNVNPTNRNNQQSEYVAPGGHYNGGLRNQTAERESCPYYKRETTQVAHTTNGGRMQILQNPNEVVGMTKYNNDCNSTEVSHPKGPNGVLSSKHQGQYEHAEKISVLNPRTDFSYASSQLQSNPYASSLHKQSYSKTYSADSFIDPSRPKIATKMSTNRNC